MARLNSLIPCAQLVWMHRVRIGNVHIRMLGNALLKMPSMRPSANVPAFLIRISNGVNRKSPPWTKSEEDKLRTLAASESPSTIAIRLGRSETAILHRAHRLGLALGGSYAPKEKSRLVSWATAKRLYSAWRVIAFIASSLAAIVTFLYFDTRPNVSPISNGSNAVSSLPFDLANTSHVFSITDATVECRGMVTMTVRDRGRILNKSMTGTPSNAIIATNVQIYPGQQKPFLCDISSLFEAHMYGADGHEITLETTSKKVSITMKYKTTLGYISIPRVFSTKDFVLTYTKDGGYFWSGSDPVN
jgi:hypothetical protein